MEEDKNLNKYHYKIAKQCREEVNIQSKKRTQHTY